ncbi:bifunctional p-450:nadph-p450 reductase [Paramyrothecium foliicola]|nr:bifunctional p-450:nadph-p450 reductase [Paramyrothecium foliicola]
MVVPIPEPNGLPLLGNINNLDKEFPLGSMVSLSNQFGEIYRLRFPGRTVVFVTTQALINETCDEDLYKKSINTALESIRDGVHDGLFTAREGEENWGIAHRVLMPAFGPISIRDMFDEMHDVASQLALKWARYGPDENIMVTDDFTRLALDTLALCSMGFRFNSFYSPILHPFIEAMGDFLSESGRKVNRLPVPSVFYRAVDKKKEADIEIMRTTAKDVLASRKIKKSDRRDLLTAMLEGVDPTTGKHMTDDSILDNLITFLIAGHETTSGLLSFAFYQLMKNPEVYRRAQAEVDAVCGKGTIKVQHMSKLPYVTAVLRETLRLNAPIPLFRETIINLLAKSHRDPVVYGDDVEEFKPERMFEAEFKEREKKFPNCWKPFGNGVRACIGRAFAWQESLLVMAMLLQNFNFVLQPNYVFGLKQTLTIKPKDMHMRAILRDKLTATSLEHRLAGLVADSDVDGVKTPEIPGKGEGNSRETTSTSITVLYGSNSGTCETLARRIATDAADHGFQVTKVDCLNAANGSLPTDHPVIIVTASYEGQPPENAGHFVSWIDDLPKDGSALKGVSYAVYGCGNQEWAQTFHRIPKLIDSSLEKAGADRLCEIGLADVSRGDIFTEFETWEDEKLWPTLREKCIAGPAPLVNGPRGRGISVTVSTSRTSTLRQDVEEAVVTSAKSLTTEGNGTLGAKRHLEIKLPEGMTYESGDYLAVLPINPKESVDRVIRRFHLPRDAYLKIAADSPGWLPIHESISASDLLGLYFELSQPATKRNLLSLLTYVKDETTASELKRLANDAFTDGIAAKRTSVIDVLEIFPDTIDMPFGAYLALLTPMRVRQYSISSSPLRDPTHATLTFSVVGGDLAHSGTGHLYMGVASNYLQLLEPGDTLHVSIKPPAGSHFRLPANPFKTPIICIAAGTGLAPFRAFLQERAAMQAAGATGLAPALLFFGCRSPEHDDIYREELDEWQRLGVVDDRMWADRIDLVNLWKRDAKVYVCGSRAMASSAKEVAIKLHFFYFKHPLANRSFIMKAALTFLSLAGGALAGVQQAAPSGKGCLVVDDGVPLAPTHHVRSAQDLPSNITFDVNFHISSTEANKDLITEKIVDAQWKVLYDAFAKHSIYLRLNSTIRVVDDLTGHSFLRYEGPELGWVNYEEERNKFFTESRLGGYDVLNLHFFSDYSPGASGYCSWPTVRTDNNGLDVDTDSCQLSAMVMPGITLEQGGSESWNLGHLAIHEVGHWLGLNHTFVGSCSEQGDFVSDTPAQRTETYGCPIGSDSCPDQPGLDPIHNFMGYTDDNCTNEFTPGQKERMFNVFYGFRANR